MTSGQQQPTDLLAFMHDRALTPAERKRLFRGKRSTPQPRGHAWQPGTGPEGETCGSCRYMVCKRLAKVYRKCGLMRERWTAGGATDVRAHDPACKKWEKPE